MVPTATMSKTNRKIFTWLIARRERLAAWALLVACACLSPWPHGASAAEINAATTAKPAGFADIVAKVKPAVIAVTVRLESDAQMDADEPGKPPQSQPFSEDSPLHRYFFGSPNQQRQASPARQIKMALG
jgi:S1-C subfamily serine protease